MQYITKLKEYYGKKISTAQTIISIVVVLSIFTDSMWQKITLIIIAYLAAAVIIYERYKAGEMKKLLPALYGIIMIAAMILVYFFIIR